MKICSRCKQELDESFFHKSSKRGYQTYCKECSSKIRSKHFQDHKPEERRVKKVRRDKIVAWFNEIRPKECSSCHDKRYYLIELHHEDPDEKEYNVTDMLTLSKKRILEEIAKCIPLCANCHRELHWKLKQEDL